MKILYITHTPWGWIKQRPQFLADMLSNDFEIDVYFRKSNHLNTNYNKFCINTNMNIKGFRMLPFERINFLSNFNTSLFNKFLFKLEFVNYKKYDYIWLTEPQLYSLIPKKYASKIIYDCMDDCMEFPYMKKHKNLGINVLNMEKEILEKSKFVFCSSEYLKDKIQSRAKLNRTVYIINNAISKDFFMMKNKETNLINKYHKPLVYFGTISEWFDFENVIRALNEFKDLNIILIGPLRTKNIPKHENLIILDPIKHEMVNSIMSKACALIMPFVVNELIKSVNPVKLYEYIFSGKPILASRYGETERFNEYISLYSNYSEFKYFIKKYIIDDNIINEDIKQKMKLFSMENTWENRYIKIKNIISNDL